jgi:hypothetical protein
MAIEQLHQQNNECLGYAFWKDKDKLCVVHNKFYLVNTKLRGTIALLLSFCAEDSGFDYQADAQYLV